MPTTIVGKVVFTIGVLLTLLLQYSFWFGDGGVIQRHRLQSDIQHLYNSNTKLQATINTLSQEVNALKTGLETVETHARLDLGFIKPDETFIKISTLESTTTHAPQAGDSDAAIDGDLWATPDTPNLPTPQGITDAPE